MTFHHEFVLNVFYVRFVLVGGLDCANPAEWHRLQVPLTCVTAVTFFTQPVTKKAGSTRPLRKADTRRLPSNIDQNYQENPKKGPDREKCQRADLERIKPRGIGRWIKLSIFFIGHVAIQQSCVNESTYESLTKPARNI